LPPFRMVAVRKDPLPAPAPVFFALAAFVPIHSVHSVKNLRSSAKSAVTSKIH
jgi:hypothetical protein